MAWKYKDEFLKDWGNQKGEPKNHYDIYDYMHWLENKLSDRESQGSRQSLKYGDYVWYKKEIYKLMTVCGDGACIEGFDNKDLIAVNTNDLITIR